MTDKVLCPWCEKEMRPYPHQGYYWYQCECGARSPTLWHATQEQTKAKAISYTQELNRLKTENECYSHNIKNLTTSNMLLYQENKSLYNNLAAMATTMSNSAKGTRAEAIKEFADRLKAKKHECGCNFRKKPVFAVTEEKIDEAYKEMVGEQG